MTDKLARRTVDVRREEPTPETIEIGQWYWVKHKEWDGKGRKNVSRRTLACVTRVGSNYAKLRSVEDPHTSEWRVHFDGFSEECIFEPDAARIIGRRVAQHQRAVGRLMNDVRELTARLGVGNRTTLGDGSETQALAVRVSDQPIDAYKTALIKAQKEDLPELFKRIETEHKAVAAWMSASLIPARAQADSFEPAIARIKARIFNVELYAGLTEKVVQIAAGEPAPLGERLRVFQRRAYMDEECLVDYQTGGMAFADIGEFDAWIAEPKNRDRLLPFPRSLVAFRVRRSKKEHDFSIAQWISFSLSGEGNLDKLTFLYIRNGDRLFRLKTAIEFGSRLFGDTSHDLFDGSRVLYAKPRDCNRDADADDEHGWYRDTVITEYDYLARRAEYEAEKKTAKRGNYVSDSAIRDFEKWTPESVYYDDISAYVKRQIDKHNRLVLVLQGLFDRSEILHPHPPYQLWSAGGFAAALELVYDDSRGMTTGDKPDFEAYRARLNATLKSGSVTVGQDDAWAEREAGRENDRQERDWRIRNKSEYKRYRPSGDPGPGALAFVSRATKTKCSFKWLRERRRDSRRDDLEPVPCAIDVPVGRLLNVDAYAVGDFKQFFADPRTRAEYLEWAPLLLEAEEWHAGNRSVGSQPKKKRR